jgi:serine kinase of HPr protein (carbohydrate metabolism regulator)
MHTEHATCVALDGAAVLLRGPSGSGKSDLALRAIDAGWSLVADDRVVLSIEYGRLYAAAPPALAGLIEVRGVGLVAAPSLPRAPVALAIDLVAPADIERLPDETTTLVLGVRLPCFQLAPFEPSALAKLKLVLSASARQGGLLSDAGAPFAITLQ